MGLCFGLGRVKYILKGKSRDLFCQRFGKPIEEYKSFQIAVSRLSSKTFINYLRILPNFFLFLNQTPDQVIEQRKKDIAVDNEFYERRTFEYVKLLKEKDFAGMGIRTHVNRIQGFFRNNNNRLALDMRKLRISKARKKRKYSPSNEEVRVLFEKADNARDKLLIAIQYQNGAAPKDVSLLKCGDYPLKPWVYFERSRSKTGEVWRGVSTPDVCKCLKIYLNVRGHYAEDDPLFLGREGPLDSQGIGTVIREILRKTDLGSIEGFKPTSLRDAFEDALVDVETYSKIKASLMGHSSGIEHHYGGYKQTVTKIVEAMRKVYPLICLTDDDFERGSVSGLSVEDLEVVHELVKDKEVFRELARLMREKKIQVID